MAFKVLVTARSFRKVPGRHQELLREPGYEVMESPQDRPLREAEMIELIGDVDGAIPGLDEMTAAVIEASRQLKVISRYGVGVDNIDLKAATAAGVVVTNTPGTNQIAVAELTLGLMLALARHIPQHDAKTKAGSWKRTTGVELAAKTLGIIGLGQIGREVIKRAAGFAMRFLVHTRYPDGDFGQAYGVEFVSLERLLQEADFVSLHCVLTPERVDLINEEALKAMRPTAYLINTARGELVDEMALYRALEEGWIAAAAMDAFREEPATNSPLLKLDNFIASPHAGAATYESVGRMGLMASQNLIAVLEGERPPHVVNPEVYGQT